MDGGSAENAGAIFCPSIHGHSPLPRIHAPAAYRPSMDIKKPASLEAGKAPYALLAFRVYKLATPKMVYINARIQAVPNNVTTLDHRGRTIVVPLVARKNKGDTVRLHVRAGDVALATQRPEKTSFRNVLCGTILSIDQGDDSAFAIVSMDIDGITLRARLTRQAMQELELAPGVEVFALLKTASFDRRE